MTGDPRTHPLTWRVRTAHGDAWQAHGRLRAGLGGGALEIPGIRLMSSGIAAPQWNNGDVTDRDLVDLDAVRSWYAERNVPWGVGVPSGAQWPHGRHLFAKRCMAVSRADLRPAADVGGLEVAPATADELDVFAAVDAAAFQEDDVEPTRE